MKQLTKEQAIRYFQRMGIEDTYDVRKFLHELGELDLMVEFITPSDIFIPQITSLNPTKRVELAQLLRKVARVIELSDVAFPMEFPCPGR